jgi:hypothetical protein
MLLTQRNLPYQGSKWTAKTLPIILLLNMKFLGVRSLFLFLQQSLLMEESAVSLSTTAPVRRAPLASGFRQRRLRANATHTSSLSVKLSMLGPSSRARTAPRRNAPGRLK